jgi:hypothetical protein
MSQVMKDGMEASFLKARVSTLGKSAAGRNALRFLLSMTSADTAFRLDFHNHLAVIDLMQACFGGHVSETRHAILDELLCVEDGTDA